MGAAGNLVSDQSFMASSDKEPGMDLRLLLAFALSAVVLIGWVYIQQKYFPTPRPPARPALAPVAARPVEPPKPAAHAPVGPARQASQETETIIENNLYRATFTNRGAVVKSWTLKLYQDARGRPLELVNQPAAASLGYPFLIWTEDEALRNKLGAALFQEQSAGARAPATLLFEYSDSEVSARKEFRFQHNSYVVEVSSEVRRAGGPLPHELAWRGSFGDWTEPDAHLTTGVVMVHANPLKMERHAYSDISAENKAAGSFLYGGIEDRFFAAVFMPPAEAGPGATLSTVQTFRSEYQPPGVKNPTVLVGVGVGGAAQNRLRAFVGPKALDVLSGVFPEPGAEQKRQRGEPVLTLGELVDFGWFALIAKPLFLGLKWIYNNVVPNYGWAIVLLTVVINFLLFPLKLKSMKSALKMQKIGPQVRAIQEKYKKLKFNDPRKQQQNQETMDLYRKHGINPIGGCFPMLLQIPFLYAFYKVLAISIEMRHAPWFGWIKDLSTKDPYYVLPIVMTGTMYFLQKMTPQTTTDPMQQKMFTMMPLIFGVMFLNVSSGLVLYWLVGNVVGLAQQWYINKSGLSKELAAKPALARK